MLESSQSQEQNDTAVSQCYEPFRIPSDAISPIYDNKSQFRAGEIFLEIKKDKEREREKTTFSHSRKTTYFSHGENIS